MATRKPKKMSPKVKALLEEKGRQTEETIFENCKRKYTSTQEYLRQLEAKKQKIEDEIAHLQLKQADRKKFLEDVAQRHAED